MKKSKRKIEGESHFAENKRARREKQRGEKGYYARLDKLRLYAIRRNVHR